MGEPGLICYDIESWLALHELSPEDDGEPQFGRREHVQEALVKETRWNDGVAGPEQRRVLSVGRDVCYTTVFSTQLYHDESDPVSW